jgi:hypothetical protein
MKPGSSKDSSFGTAIVLINRCPAAVRDSVGCIS